MGMIPNHMENKSILQDDPKSSFNFMTPVTVSMKSLKYL